MVEKKPSECGYAVDCCGISICGAEQIPCQRVKKCPKDPHRMDGIISAMKILGEEQKLKKKSLEDLQNEIYESTDEKGWC